MIGIAKKSTENNENVDSEHIKNNTEANIDGI